VSSCKPKSKPQARSVALAAADIEFAASLLKQTSAELLTVGARLTKAARLVRGAKGGAA
jgi:hypothetical protein